MSKTLNLVDSLLLLGRRHHQLGRINDAFSIFTRLTQFRELPSEVAEETLVRLAEIQLKRKRYRRARRHLVAALRHDDQNARSHYLLASALRRSGEDHWERALTHYRRAVELNPTLAECLTEFGLFAVRLGHTEEGLACMRRALEQQPDDPCLVQKLSEALQIAGLWSEARQVLREALFRHPRDRRFRRLWLDYRFQQVRREQRLQQRRRATQAEDPVVLPFRMPADSGETTSDKTETRTDGPATLPGPHGRVKNLPHRHVQ